MRILLSVLGLLAWLAAHPCSQVPILLGNHDLARASELATYDDASYADVRAAADAAYRAADAERERELLDKHPELPTAEMLARDYSSFHVAQRDLVWQLLRARRMRVAVAAGPNLLLLHAGVTSDDLESIGLPGEKRDAIAIAAALNAHLDGCVDACRDGPLTLPPLHRISSRDGEARGIFHHRPSDPRRESGDLFAGPPRRRFDPRRLPRGVVQAIGHIRDGKCRKLLGEWAAREEERDGPLRHLVTDGDRVRYARGVRLESDPSSAVMIFLDGGMSYGSPEDYELLRLP